MANNAAFVLFVFRRVMLWIGNVRSTRVYTASNIVDIVDFSIADVHSPDQCSMLFVCTHVLAWHMQR